MNGELYPGEFEAMERQGRLDAVIPEQKMMTSEEACPICINRNNNCQFGSLDCHFEEQIDTTENGDVEWAMHTLSKSNNEDEVNHAMQVLVNHGYVTLDGDTTVLNPNKNRVKTELDQARDILRNAAWLGTNEDRERIERAVELLCGETCEDAINRKATVERLCKVAEFMNEKRNGLGSPYVMAALFIQDNKEEFPSVTPKQRTGWIPITYRLATDEEKKDYAERTGYDEEDIDTILNCKLPEDGETVLITDRLGNVEVDTFIRDCDECYFECNCDMEDVRAWMPLPKPYEPQESEEQE